jgi:hypothetical protein
MRSRGRVDERWIGIRGGDLGAASPRTLFLEKWWAVCGTSKLVPFQSDRRQMRVLRLVPAGRDSPRMTDDFGGSGRQLIFVARGDSRFLI